MAKQVYSPEVEDWEQTRSEYERLLTWNKEVYEPLFAKASQKRKADLSLLESKKRKVMFRQGRGEMSVAISPSRFYDNELKGDIIPTPKN